MLYNMVLTTNDLPILRIVYIAKTFLSILSIAVPIILIIIASIELFKVIANPNEAKKTVSKILNKFIYAIIIFFIPILVNFTMNMISQNSLDKIEYWNSADKKTIKILTKAKEREIELRKRIANEEKVKELQYSSVRKIDNLNGLVDKLGDKLSDEEKQEVNEAIISLQESVKTKLTDEKRSEVLSQIDELKSYFIPNADYSLDQLRNIISNSSESQNKDLIYKYLDDINDSIIEMEETENKVETTFNKLKKNLDLNSSNIKNINVSIRKINSVINDLRDKLIKENKKQNGNIVYAASTTQRDKIVEFALQHVGVTPYVYGGTNLRTGADCSGFIQAVYANFGISIPRTTITQAVAGKKVSLSQVRPGDLIFSRNYGHVTMYIGNNQVVQAQCTACGPVKITNIPSNAHDAVTFLND